jgi:hypothetical protein
LDLLITDSYSEGITRGRQFSHHCFEEAAMTITATAPAVTTRTAEARPTPDAAALLDWGFAVEKDGIAAHEDTAAVIVEAATRKGLRPILIDILADRREPSVARQRAFGRLAFALAQRESRAA